MSDGKIFSRGPTVVKFHFVNSETMRKTFFYYNFDSKILNFKIPRGLALLPLLPTPMNVHNNQWL